MKEFSSEVITPIIAKSLESIFSEGLVDRLIEVIYKTPNPVVATEVLLGIDKKPGRFSFIDKEICKFLSYSKWEDTDSYSRRRAVKYECIRNSTIETYWLKEAQSSTDRSPEKQLELEESTGVITASNFAELGGKLYDDFDNDKDLELYYHLNITGPKRILIDSCSIEQWSKKQSWDVNECERETVEWMEKYDAIVESSKRS